MKDEQLRIMFLHNEFRDSVKLIRLGFAEIQNISLDNNFYHLPLQLLSSGIERFLKCYICLGFHGENNTFPELKMLKNHGHDIQKLKKTITEKYFSIRHSNDEYLKKDRDFISNDKNLNQLLYLLSEFGKFARYHNFDIVTGHSKPSINVEKEWEEFETKLLKDDNTLFKHLKKLYKKPNDDEMYISINIKIITILEKFIRGLSKQFTFVDLGELAKQFSPELFDFMSIDDKDLGKTNYNLLQK
ncbi:hypothetical protein [Dokdonia pacifica]|nr:hypothetical protein [Dokdonia pacifica]